MTSVAILADIHGNPFALEAVIEEIARLSPDEVIVAGDLVGRGPMGSAVVDRVRELGWPSIRGNHEDYMLSFCRKDVPAEWLSTDEWAASRWMAAELGSEQRAWIDALPFSTTSAAEPLMRVVHGTPRSHSEGLGTWSSEEDLDLHLNSVEEQTLICAHTHRPMERERPGGLVVNTGSVGLPFNGDWRAQYALLHREGDRWRPEFRQVEYDRDAFLRGYETTGFLSEGLITAQLLRFEVETARPHLVPFLTWCRITNTPPEPERLDAFFQVFDPTKSMRTFIHKIKALVASPSGD